MEQELKALLGSLKDYLPKLIAACDTVAEEIKFGDKEKGYATLAAVFDGLSWVYDALGAVARAVPEEVAELNWPREVGFLGQLEQALVDRDDVLVADIIYYEVREVMARVQSAVDALIKKRIERH